MVDMLLPDRVHHRVCQRGYLLKKVHDHDNDIRNNLVGAKPAAQIIQIDLIVETYLGANRDPATRLRSIETLQRLFPYMKRDSLEEEFDLTASAPISEKLVPPLEAIPLLHPELYTDANGKDEL